MSKNDSIRHLGSQISPGILDHIVDKEKNELIKAVQELVRIRSVIGNPGPKAPFGTGPAQALTKSLEIAKLLGFRTVNLDNYIGFAEYGHGEDYIAILGHVDVVPEGEGWTYPPFEAIIQDEKIYGRGTTDDKGPILAALFGLKAVRDSGQLISKKVRIIFGTNEESDNADIKYYLEREPAPISGFTPDGLYPVIYSEKGILDFDLVKNVKISYSESDGSSIVLKSLQGGEAPNMVPSKAEALIETKDPFSLKRKCLDFASEEGYELTAMIDSGLLHLRSDGISAHGSVPEDGKNAVMQLLAFLGTQRFNSQDIQKAIYFLNQNINMETDGKSFGLAMEDAPSGKLSLNLGMVEFIQDCIKFSVDIRYPVTKTVDDVLKILKEKIVGTFRLENLRNQDPLYYPIDHPLVKTLHAIFDSQTDQKTEPLAVGGGTYAKVMPNILAFGPIFPGNPLVEHIPNEYIAIKDLMLNSKIYAHAIYELSR
jgi:succinyl-diaminopimelate desuccinylase